MRNHPQDLKGQLVHVLGGTLDQTASVSSGDTMLTGSRRRMTDLDRRLQAVGRIRQSRLPSAASAVVAAYRHRLTGVFRAESLIDTRSVGTKH
jgi:hypothetical protein